MLTFTSGSTRMSVIEVKNPMSFLKKQSTFMANYNKSDTTIYP